MRQFLFLASLIFMSFASYSQDQEDILKDQVHLKSGEIITANKLKFGTKGALKTVKFKDENKEKHEISVTEIDYIIANGEEYYPFVYKRNEIVKYDWFTIEIDGEVQLLKWYDINRTGGFYNFMVKSRNITNPTTPNPNVDDSHIYALRKGDGEAVYIKTSNQIDLSRKREIELLQEYLGDNEKILTAIQSEDFKPSMKNIMRLVRTYNDTE